MWKHRFVTVVTVDKNFFFAFRTKNVHCNWYLEIYISKISTLREASPLTTIILNVNSVCGLWSKISKRGNKRRINEKPSQLFLANPISYHRESFFFTFGLTMKPLSKMNYKSCSINVRGKYCLIVAPFLIYGLYKTPIYRRGFYCFDTSIQHPFRNLMVPTWLLFLLTLFLPLITIYCIQKFAIKCPERTAAELSKFFFGFLVNLSITEMCKHGFGRLRPNTYDCCQLARYCQSGKFFSEFFFVSPLQFSLLQPRITFTLTILFASTIATSAFWTLDSHSILVTHHLAAMLALTWLSTWIKQSYENGPVHLGFFESVSVWFSFSGTSFPASVNG